MKIYYLARTRLFLRRFNFTTALLNMQKETGVLMSRKCKANHFMLDCGVSEWQINIFEITRSIIQDIDWCCGVTVCTNTTTISGATFIGLYHAH